MGVKGDNLEINSGLVLSSFILNYMVIRVKQREFERGEKLKRKEERTSERERRTKRNQKALEK